MSKSLLQTRIVDKLETIMVQVDTMNKFGKNIPLIHLDILKSNIRTLYEQICELERTQADTNNAKKVFGSMVKEPEVAVVPQETEERIVNDARETISKLVESIQDDVAGEFEPEINFNMLNAVAEQTEMPTYEPVAVVEETTLLKVEAPMPEP
ncbi:MAG: hypothetical protein LBU91_02655, partial [Bacteroidales bacterium]|nr:hypothetical protein [Bacteroidales bacterium]